MNNVASRHFLSCNDLSQAEMMFILRQTETVERLYKTKRNDISQLLRGKILATLFFEPSTRTRLSFETAMLRLGGQVITMEQGSSSSVNKGETLEDMACVINCYADVVAVRHPEPFSVMRFASHSKIPVLNAGDGANEHPTQALLDLYTIYKLQKLNGNKKTVIGLVGDLKNARTVHSLIKLLKYFNVQFVFISSSEVKLPADLLEDVKKSGCGVQETADLNAAMPELDVLYVTRVQRERFECQDTYQRVKNLYHVDEKLLQQAKPDLSIMHPLPRVDEIAKSIDTDPRAVYFQQVENGIYLRMALLLLALSITRIVEVVA